MKKFLSSLYGGFLFASKTILPAVLLLILSIQGLIENFRPKLLLDWRFVMIMTVLIVIVIIGTNIAEVVYLIALWLDKKPFIVKAVVVVLIIPFAYGTVMFSNLYSAGEVNDTKVMIAALFAFFALVGGLLSLDKEAKERRLKEKELLSDERSKSLEEGKSYSLNVLLDLCSKSDSLIKQAKGTEKYTKNKKEFKAIIDEKSRYVSKLSKKLNSKDYKTKITLQQFDEYQLNLENTLNELEKLLN